ncbi:TPM domain-containing protein [Cellulomonas triticagri]|uniref:TPM domain-containing protein n=1 Tax=Cellulomonas triticagri TaxID=2483352 RepID=A0A3M2JGE2_9CELL|nr:TPM domain-containing protein [Cellulomonas triticagri]RMI12882.1 TPM domain-containing protein [Cellulomonas triticagri]
MHPSAHPARRPWVTTAVALVVAAAGLLATAGPAAAEPPLNLPGPVTDLVDALTPAEEAEVAAALDDLADSSPFELFVVYVDDFDGWDNRDWADATASASGLGRDDVLLAVAVDARRYQVRVQGDNALTDGQLATVEQERIEPALRDGDWAGAAVAAAAGYADPPASGSWADFAVVAAVLVGTGLTFASPVWIPLTIWLVRRRRRAKQAAADLAALEDRSALALVAADEAVARGVQEHAFAEAQFGPVTVAPFTEALARSREVLAEGFRLRQVLDDDEHEPAARRREVAEAVLRACERVEALISAQEAAAGRHREAHARAPQDLADARTAAHALSLRVEAADRSWVVVRQQYAPSATADVPGAVAQARAAAALAVEHVSAGLAALEDQRGRAVVLAREAHAALARGASVLDGLDRRAADLAAAPGAVVLAITALDEDLADVARLAAEGEDVRTAASAARAALERARTDDVRRDPLAVLEALRAAERDLDRALEPARAPEVALRLAVERLPGALGDVDRLVARARARIEAGGSAVGVAARTRLSEAERLAGEGAALASVDPLGAMAVLRQAADRAEQADFQATRNQDTAGLRAAGFDTVNGADRRAVRWTWTSGSSGGSRGGGSGGGGSSSSGGSRGGGGRF